MASAGGGLLPCPVRSRCGLRHRLPGVAMWVVAARNPQHRESLIAAAAFERDRGRLAQAEGYARAALALDPRDREATALLAEITARVARPGATSP